MGKQKHFKFMGFLNISEGVEIHTIPKTRGRWIFTLQIPNSHYEEKTGKNLLVLSNIVLVPIART